MQWTRQGRPREPVGRSRHEQYGSCMNQRSGDRQASIQQPRKTKLLSCSPTKLKELHGGRATTDDEPFLSRKTSLLSAPTMKSLGGSESENTPGKQPPQSYLGGLNRWSLGVGRVMCTGNTQHILAYFPESTSLLWSTAIALAKSEMAIRTVVDKLVIFKHSRLWTLAIHKWIPPSRAGSHNLLLNDHRVMVG
ncbi:hypothetical protein ASPWEDRAFT_31816 [Aspergillus wentii DTO 134E9]|uniref:Uncharacterized protein n=1 Tax=Aspergillus wentii DTO 134E9 TaxID=1073089 RepID=A0A1L9R897_ASPWE|nr:uncharacterized protein ASPWEDRAFT_31816 [Aspergillus wentii DTO 134E9]OJJ31141.1 hypothetical protein ASPWEDRAFT_31816 [Aspergillus wentii DTO 134E9]